MIDHDGSLRVAVPDTDVTWFAFLGYSRLTNSTSGGWNSKRHWRLKGLNQLLENGFVEKWTKNTLADETLPKARASDFMFQRNDSKERKALLPNRHLARGCREDALNALIRWKMQNEGIKEFGGWNFLGYEIPLSEERDGQLKVDLYGIHSEENRIGIIELKRGTNVSDSPLMALTEAICYGLQSLRCEVKIKTELELPDDWKMSEVHLTLAAPSEYWSYWEFDPCGKNKEEFLAIIEHINCGVQQTGRASRFKLEMVMIPETFFVPDSI